MTEKISAVYKITNTVTGDFYIGSSKNIKHRWTSHKCQSTWNKCPNNPMYLDMQRYGVDKFAFEILEEVEIDKLKEKEQKFIELLNPTYNDRNANGFDFERRKKTRKEAQKKYNKSDKYKESRRKSSNKYYNQLCSFNGETLTLRALYIRFWRQGIINPAQEAKKYIIKR